MPPPRAALLSLALGLAALTGCTDEAALPVGFADREPAALAELAVEARADASRSYFFADRSGTFFYDELAGAQTDPAMGYVAGDFRVVDGWRWWFYQDSVALGPQAVTGGIVRPDFAARSYVEPDTSGFFEGLLQRLQGFEPKTLTEVVSLAGGALYVEIPDSVGTLELIPTFSDRRVASDYQTEAQGNTLLVARGNYLEARAGSPRPVWLAVAAEDGVAVRQGEEITDGLGARERSVAVGRVRFETPGAVAFASGNTPEAAAANARRALAEREARQRRRAERLVAVLDEAWLRTEDDAFNHAFAWARLSLDALTREDSVSFDVLPGIPGTDLVPGRPMISTVSALLATGQWEDARKMLQTYARAQRRDSRIDYFGRVPNRFTATGQPQYTTVEATPAWVAAVGDYLRTTGDRSIITDNGADFWTRTVYAVRGLYNETSTPDGYLRNQPGETWVRPFEGRGRAARTNRAAETQGQFYRALRAMQPIARIMGQLSGRPTSAQAYGDSAAALQRRFERDFVRDDAVADFLPPSGAPSAERRPSALLALRAFDLDPEAERRILRRTAADLAYAHGVSTRPQTDSLFHPYLRAADYYEPDAARFDGPVWTWLSGPLISALVEHGAPDRAYEQLAALQRLVLERGVVGAIAENVDAHPRRLDGEELAEPEVGGAPVQPWSLAEFVRTSVQDFAGVRYRGGRTVLLEPRLPEPWGETSVRFRLGDGAVRATMRQSASELAVSLVPEGALPRDGVVRVHAFGQVKAVPVTRMQGDTLAVPADSVALTITADQIRLGGETVQPDSSYTPPGGDFWADFAWAEPQIPERYPVMRAVERERQLEETQVSRTNPLATPILSRTDPDGDDWGTTATYTYPDGFPRGILDATYLEVAKDDSMTYVRIEFAALTNDDAFGYQPTFAALAFDTEEGGQREVGRNSLYRFAAGSGYEYIAFVGDALQVEDASGRVLGRFPNLGDALVSTDEAAIQFSLPRFVLPELPRGTNVTLLVGARSEGRDIGEFRRVVERGSAVAGGGKINPRDPNIYDVVNARVER